MQLLVPPSSDQITTIQQVVEGIYSADPLIGDTVQQAFFNGALMAGAGLMIAAAHTDISMVDSSFEGQYAVYNGGR